MSSVLLAEPSAAVAGTLRRYLEGAGHEVSWVGGADEALRLTRERPPDVLLASGTGALDGEALCRGLRARGSALPLLLVYPPDEDHADERAAEAGADGCLVGPLKRGTVLTCVALLVQREAARQQAGSRVGDTGHPPEGMPRAMAAPEVVATSLVAPAEDFFGLNPTPAAMPAPAPVAPPPGPAAAVGPSRSMGFAITPVPGTLSVLEPEGRRVTRPELPAVAVGTSPDFEFLKRLMLMEVKRSRRYRYPIAVLLVELDGFAERSASLSPAGRTALLAEALGVLVAGVRDIDVAVPFAESRFVVFLPHTPKSGALVVAERLRERMKAARTLPDVSVSVGVAVSEPPSGKAPPSASQPQVSFGGLLKEAGEALRRAQAAGGNRVEPAAGGRPQPG
ncbi:diguanylate cyclase [Pyxidicoccus xibeiensis]|uniref:diguanylate cyclase n=1 Tax=Pyxidicoccus xibeiensis TaxID=2906759 RepID=UPI0020A79B3F|nr:diguanylate cyclase [Pyxidicoccus xibeiensis]MCP3140443.1 diguanylate cyclase [Pyxidicoccus xibeiensis]